MDLALHFRSVNPLIKLGFRRTRAYNSLSSEIVDDPIPSFRECLSRTASSGNRCIRLSSSLIGRRKKGFVCCKKQSDEQKSNQSKLKQEEMVSLLRRIQSSISKERKSRGAEEEKNRDGSYENKTLSKAILNILEKPREKTEGDTEVKEETPKRREKVARPPSSFAKRSPKRPPSGPKAKPPVSLEQETEKEEEKPPLIETTKLAELKEVAKSRGIKGYSKLKKSELLKLIRSS